MAGIPKLPGYTFNDPTLKKFNRSQTFNIHHGCRIPRSNYCGIGGKALAANSVKFADIVDVARFDPSLTYGRTKTITPPLFLPHYALYTDKNLTFQAFFKQGIMESPNEFYRVRRVRIIYFLEDDTITVFEPKIRNSGMDQGRVVRRARIPKNEQGEYWHWKDFNVGKDVSLNGIVFHIVDCDKFTRDYMASQGLIMREPEEMPEDPYIFDRKVRVRTYTHKTKSDADKLRRFLEFDGKVLRFKAVWDDRENEYGDLMKYEIMYFLSDYTVSVKQIHTKNNGRDPYPMLLRRIKLPKRYTDTPATYPAVYLELSDAEVTEYYLPKDFRIGETIFVLGRDMLLYDCDDFTRHYYRKALEITQPKPIDISEPSPPSPARYTPPHDGIGSLEDSLQNTLTFIPKPPRKNITMSLMNANKYLRYEMVMDTVHPEDSIRRFVLSYSLADGTCRIREPPIRNSGIMGGKYLRAEMLIKPGSDRLNPDYYSPRDFYIGAMISVFKQRFKIVGADLYVYRYMEANMEKFPPEVVEGMRNYMFNKGYLNADVDDQIKENFENERRWDLDTSLAKRKSELEECYKELKVGGGFDPADQKKIMDKIRAEYEEGALHKPDVPPYGIKRVEDTCPYPTRVGEIKSDVCKEEEEGEYASYTPKHVSTPEEIRAKYYAGVLKGQHEICDEPKIVCTEPPPLVREPEEGHPPPQPIIVSTPEIPVHECSTKSVTFAQDPRDRCDTDRHDLCNLNAEITHANCMDYQKDCISP